MIILLLGIPTRNTIRVPNSLDPGQADSLPANLGLNCFKCCQQGTKVATDGEKIVGFQASR